MDEVVVLWLRLKEEGNEEREGRWRSRLPPKFTPS
jgi:hypothetical protein